MPSPCGRVPAAEWIPLNGSKLRWDIAYLRIAVGAKSGMLGMRGGSSQKFK